MCVGIPGKIIEIKGKKAKIKQGDHSHWVDISLLAEKVKPGDYITLYQGTAVNVISAREAKEILDLMDSTGNAGVKGAD